MDGCVHAQHRHAHTHTMHIHRTEAVITMSRSLHAGSTKTFMKDTHGKPNEQFCPIQVVMQVPVYYLKTATSTFTYFLF